MSLDAYFSVGTPADLGSHRFDADAIKAFAAKYDPQPFHTDEEAARRSVFGGLCASGWHTLAIWMKLNVAAGYGSDRGDGAPEIGPSPGFRDLKWLRPVHAGETISYRRTVTGHRPMATRPGWHLVSFRGEAFAVSGEPVMTFEGAFLARPR